MTGGTLPAAQQEGSHSAYTSERVIFLNDHDLNNAVKSATKGRLRVPEEVHAKLDPQQQADAQEALTVPDLAERFALDVFACVRCGGRRRVVAYLTAPGGVRAILEHLGLPSRPAKRAPAQGPAQWAWC